MVWALYWALDIPAIQEEDEDEGSDDLGDGEAFVPGFGLGGPFDGADSDSSLDSGAPDHWLM